MARILVIDDDRQFLGYLDEAISRAGYLVETARNGKEGLEVIDRAEIDLIITDIFMPEKDGIELLRQFRHKKSDIKVIAISGGMQGSSSENILKIARIIGARRTLEKPFTKTDLIPIIREVLEERD